MCSSSVRSARQVLSDPRPVVVDFSKVWQPQAGTGSPPIHLRDTGLQLTSNAPGILTEWWRAFYGDWFARVEVDLTIDGERVAMDLLIPARAVKPAPDT